MSATRIDRILGFEHGLPPAYAAMVALVGLVFLVFGWRLHRLTLAACGFFIGSLAGALLAKWIGVEQGWGFGPSLACEPPGKSSAFHRRRNQPGYFRRRGRSLGNLPGGFSVGFLSRLRGRRACEHVADACTGHDVDIVPWRPGLRLGDNWSTGLTGHSLAAWFPGTTPDILHDHPGAYLPDRPFGPEKAFSSRRPRQGGHIDARH